MVLGLSERDNSSAGPFIAHRRDPEVAFPYSDSKSHETVVAAQGASEVVLPARVQEALGELVGAAREGLLALSVGVGLGVLVELMEEEETVEPDPAPPPASRPVAGPNAMPDQDAGRSGPSATQPWTAQEISAPAQLPPTLPGEPGPDDQADDDAAANEHPRDVMSWLARGASSTC